MATPNGHSFLYLLGCPGSGKSTLMQALTRGRGAMQFKRPMAYIVWDAAEPVIELGARRDGFAGTDALPMNVIARAEAFVEAQPTRLMFAEGDRLANDRFFAAVEKAGYELTLVYLDTPPDVAAKWRRQRARRLGTKPQDPRWVQGRATKQSRLAARHNAVVISSTDLGKREAKMLSLGNPVVDALALVSAAHAG